MHMWAVDSREINIFQPEMQKLRSIVLEALFPRSCPYVARETRVRVSWAKSGYD